MPSHQHPFFFQSYGDHRDLHSFPTRRSSDLKIKGLKSKVGKRTVGFRHSMHVFFLLVSAALLVVCSNNFSRSEEHTSELQSRPHLVCRLLLEKKKNKVSTVVELSEV